MRPPTGGNGGPLGVGVAARGAGPVVRQAGSSRSAARSRPAALRRYDCDMMDGAFLDLVYRQGTGPRHYTQAAQRASTPARPQRRDAEGGDVPHPANKAPRPERPPGDNEYGRVAPRRREQDTH